MLRNARGERTLVQVALGAGISPETLRKIETGRITTPSFLIVAALADELALSLDAIQSRIRTSSSEQHDVAS
jgi:transcriptional regulator with XRE-family HTH domain